MNAVRLYSVTQPPIIGQTNVRLVFALYTGFSTRGITCR